MTTSEFAFLVMGLVLGVAAGAALVEFLRARPAAPREVRVTVATDAVPRRRSTTLADDAFTMPGPEPARGGPADRRSGAVMAASDSSDPRTPVPFAIRPDDGGDGSLADVGMEPALPLREAGSEADQPDRTEARRWDDRWPLDGRAAMVAIPVTGGHDPMFMALHASPSFAATAVSPTRGATALLAAPAPARPAVRSTVVAIASVARAEEWPDASDPERLSSSAADDPGVPGTVASAADGPCAEARRVADERCEVATLARAQAVMAEDALRTAQRAYDEHETHADAAAAASDPRTVRRAKDDAQLRFRAGRAGAQDTATIEGAARAWLLEINRINGEAREATAVLAREREAARVVGAGLERMSLEADAARIAAEAAEATCLAARTEVADCEEQAAGGGGHLPSMPSGAASGDLGDESLTAALSGGGTPRIFRLLRGDRSAMTELVAILAGDDEAERRRWQVAISDLVDAILADAIEASALDFPPEHPFWSPFTIAQDRDIAAALSSLGYRFDGLGGWVDERVPSQRDLSLALGYAGLDPMRIRQWPNETEMANLFAEVAVAGDEHLAGAAGDLTLGELVTMLGRRADGLADVWNHWGTIRPLLLAE
ncbi:MAG TPA: hypothetical protein VD763_13850 [Candidatus Saccharimonadales bacterium]|nr:hypothetical protein [Candidatus Saccharimonadales bacterium]